MLIISSTLIGLQFSIDVAGNNEAGRGKSGGNETNLSNWSLSKKCIKAGYLTSKGAKKGDGNIKKVVKL